MIPRHSMKRILAQTALILAAATSACAKTNSASGAGSAAEARPTVSELAKPPSPPSAAPQTREEICAAVQGLELPRPKGGSGDDAGQASAGDSVRHYYGIGTPVDYARAMDAAMRERSQSGEGSRAETVVMMLYANGRGVKQDLPVALKLACADDISLDELDGRVMRLQAMKTRRDPPPFDYCDDAVSGYTMGYCAALREQREDATRGHEIAQLIAGWTPQQRAAWRALERACVRYVESSAREETDQSGTDSELVRAEAAGALKRELVEALRRFERGERLQYGLADHRQADRELSQATKQALSHDFSGTTIRAEGIRATQRAWRVCRDAWVELGATRYPEVPAEAWKAWVTRSRTKQLQAF